jgi:hypothetical protein
LIPLYTKILVDPEKALCSQEKWNNLTQDQRLDDVREEAMVLALERYLLPQYVGSTQEAYTLALTRICTTITKGWFREFAVNHYPLLDKCPKDLSAIAKTIIKNYDEQLSEKQRLFSETSTIKSRFKEYFSDDELKTIGNYEIFANIDKHGNAINSNSNDNENKEALIVIDYDYDDIGRYHSDRDSDIIDKVHIIKLDKKTIVVWTLRSVSGSGSCTLGYGWSANISVLNRIAETIEDRKQIYKQIESRYEHNNSGHWNYENEEFDDEVYNCQIGAISEHGGSYGSNDYSLRILKSDETDNNFTIRFVCALLNPQLAYGGNIILKTVLDRYTEKLDHIYQKSPNLPSHEYQHKWTNAYILSVSSNSSTF